MRRLVNVKPLLGIRTTKKHYSAAKKRIVKLLQPSNSLKPTDKSSLGKGIFRVNKQLGDHLIKKGKAVETKEYKGKIETKDYFAVPVKKLTGLISTLTREELDKIIREDGRKTAVTLAKEELAKR